MKSPYFFTNKSFATFLCVSAFLVFQAIPFVTLAQGQLDYGSNNQDNFYNYRETTNSQKKQILEVDGSGLAGAVSACATSLIKNAMINLIGNPFDWQDEKKIKQQELAETSDLVDTGLGAVGSVTGGTTGGAISSAGNVIGNLFNGDEEEAVEEGVEGGSTAATEYVPVSDTAQQAISEDIEKVAKKNEVQDIKQKRSSYFQSQVQTCFARAAKNFADRIIDNMTLRTVQWINNGFDTGDFSGNPFYVSSTDNLFLDIQKREFGKLNLLFSYDPDLNPFGKTVLTTMLLSMQKTVEASFRNNMSAVLHGSSYDQFSVDFSVGGWNAWTELFEPENNVFGTYLLANEEYAQSTQGTNISEAVNIQAELQASGGFFGQRVCARTAYGVVSDINPYYGPEHPLHIDPTLGIVINEILDIPESVRVALEEGGQSFADPQAYVLAGKTAQRRSNCLEYKTITPGAMIKEQLGQVVTSPLRRLELVDGYEENIGLILDAVLNGVIKAGLNGLTCGQAVCSDDPSDPNYSPLQDQVNGGAPGYTNGVQSGGQGTYGSIPLILSLYSPNFLNTLVNPSGDSDGDGITNGQEAFDDAIATAINADPASFAVLQYQEDYIQALIDQQNQLAVYITNIGSLDYCIPGPNPLWYSTAANNFSTAVSQSVATAVSPSNATAFFKAKIEEITGIVVSLETAPTSQTEYQLFMERIFDEYTEALSSAYPLSGTVPAVKQQAFSIFGDVPEANADSTALIADVLLAQNASEQMVNIIESLQSLTVDQNKDATLPAYQSANQNYINIADHIGTEQRIATINFETQVWEDIVNDMGGLYNQCVAQVSGVTPSARTQHLLLEAAVGPSGALNTYQAFPPQTQHFLPSMTLGTGAGQMDLSTGFNISVLNISNLHVLHDTLNIY